MKDVQNQQSGQGGTGTAAPLPSSDPAAGPQAGQRTAPGPGRPKTSDEARSRLLEHASELVIQVLCGLGRVSREELTGPCRERKLVLLRAIGYEYLFGMYDFSTTEIGSRFGGRNHATVLNGLKKLDDWLSIGDSETVLMYKHVNEVLYGIA